MLNSRNIRILRYSASTIFAGFLLALIALYFLQFNGKLSNDKTDWGTFGDYLSGVFAMLNLGVVVVLAIYVSNNDKKLTKVE